MLTFKKPTLDDAQWVQRALRTEGPAASEKGFGSAYFWSETYNTQICRYKDALIIRYGGQESSSYDFPVHADDLHEVLELVIADARENGKTFQIWGVTPQEMELLESAMPGRFTFEPERDYFDYIYRTEDLAELKGRKYHGKRNHLMRFRRTYSYTFELLSEKNLDDCVEVAKTWCRENGCTGDLKMEECAIFKAIRSFAVLGLEGGLIKIEGKPVSFVIGEGLGPDTIDLHFEKAVSGYDGLYAAINQEFAATLVGKYQFINREEDMGLEGLRRAKLSYHPYLMLEKYTARLKEDG